MIRHGAKLTPEEAVAVMDMLSGHPGKASGVLACSTDLSDKVSAKSAQVVPIPMRLVHPVLMSMAFLLALWVAFEGMKRASFTLFKRRVKFNWKGHVLYGKFVLFIWLFGMMGGSYMAYSVHGKLGTTGSHSSVAQIILVLLLTGGATGIYLDKKKAPRKVLPLVHGVVNLAALALAVWQLGTGIGMVSALF